MDKNFADLLEHLDFDENFNLKRTDYRVIVDYTDANADATNRAVKKIYQQAAFHRRKRLPARVPACPI